MVKPKLTNEDSKTIEKLLEKGQTAKQLARQYKVSIPTIYRRGKYPYQTNNIPVEIKK